MDKKARRTAVELSKSNTTSFHAELKEIQVSLVKHQMKILEPYWRQPKINTVFKH